MNKTFKLTRFLCGCFNFSTYQPVNLSTYICRLKNQLVKLRNAILIIALIIIADQGLKIWIKTSFPFGNTELTGLEWFQLYFIENRGMAWGGVLVVGAKCAHSICLAL